MKITLAPDESTEIKVTMGKGKKVEYSWETSSGKAIVTTKFIEYALAGLFILPACILY